MRTLLLVLCLLTLPAFASNPADVDGWDAYEHGNYPLARDRFQRGAHEGVPLAAFNLAMMHRHGQGGPINPEQFLHWLRVAANGKLAVTDLKGYARELGLDGARFDRCLDSGEKAKVVASHRKAGEEAGVNGPPAFFVNGRMISGAQPLDAFKKLVDKELGLKK